MSVAAFALVAFVAIVATLGVTYRRTKARMELEDAERIIRLHRRERVAKAPRSPSP